MLGVPKFIKDVTKILLLVAAGVIVTVKSEIVANVAEAILSVAVLTV